jgi:hypothetical protein
MSVEEAINAYLADVSAELRVSFWEEQSVRDELRAHIHAIASEYELSGLEPVVALRRSLRDLGHPADVGAALRTSRGRRTFRRAHLEPADAIRLERPLNRPLPPKSLLFGLAALASTSIGIAVAFVWP